MKYASLAERIWAGQRAETKLEDDLYEIQQEAVPERWSFDEYDGSVELYGVGSEVRLSESAQQMFAVAGFSTVFVNHADGWETHYAVGKGVSPGWRVYYHRNHKGTEYIEVEKFPEGWPPDWLETGYVRVVDP